MNSKMDGKISSTNTSLQEENDSGTKESCCQIDKEMVRFKIHFFLFFGALGTILPYVPLIAKDRIGISATSQATVLTAQLFSTVITKTALGYIADYFKRMKLMMSVLIIIHCLLFISILVIPSIKRSKAISQNFALSAYFKDYVNDTELTIISMNRNTNCNDSSNLLTDFNHVESPIKDEKKSLARHSDVFCFASNVTKSTICFQPYNDTNDSNIASQVIRSFCCTVHTSTFEQYYTQLKNHFHVTVFEFEMIPNNSYCTVEVSDRLTELTRNLYVTDLETYQFWLYAVLMVLSGNCISSAFTLSDTICCDSVQKYKRDFGRQRIFSAFSWGLLAPLGGLICDLTQDFYATWILMASLQCLTLWNLYKMDIVIPRFSKNLTKDVGTVLKSPTFLAFNFGVFMNGVWSGIIWYYLIWFISSLGASTFLCGLVPYVQCFAGELPIMFFSGWIIDKIGHFNSITLSLLSYAVRFLWYSYLANPWFVLPMEVVHGFTYGLFYPAVASFGKISAKTGTEATTQSILFSTHEGLGSGIGCVLAGIGFDTFGGNWTFFYFSLLAFGSVLLNIGSTLLVGKNLPVANPVTPS